jgi:hypothetical protein
MKKLYSKPGSYGTVKRVSVDWGTADAPLGLTDNVDNNLNTIGPSPSLRGEPSLIVHNSLTN